MGRTRLLLPRKASAGGSEEGAGVLGVWVGAGSRLPCLAGAASCWHKATWLGPLLVGHIYALSSSALAARSPRWCPSLLAKCPGQPKSCRNFCQEWADTRQEPSLPSPTGR